LHFVNAFAILSKKFHSFRRIHVALLFSAWTGRFCGVKWFSPIFMNRIDRLVATVLLLQSRRLIRAQDIADHFGISVRTVYRDLLALQEAGVPLAAETGEGYSIVEGYHLPPVMFTQEEASALFVGGEFVQRLTDASLKKHAESALLKIRAVLPEDRQEYLERLQQATAVFTQPAHRENGFRDDVLALMQDAVVHRRVLKMEYSANSNDEITKRSVEPMALLYYSNHWHLIAYCRLRQDYRDFRTDRIISIQPADEKFFSREGFSIKQYLQDANKIENPQEVRIKFKPAVARRVRGRYFWEVSEERTEDNGAIITFIVPTLEVLVDWLLSFGTEIEILHPPQLRQLLLERAQKAVAYFSA
jgi:predicted DNA-binding transcriptional regulator YafY